MMVKTVPVLVPGFCSVIIRITTSIEVGCLAPQARLPRHSFLKVFTDAKVVFSDSCVCSVRPDGYWILSFGQRPVGRS